MISVKYVISTAGLYCFWFTAISQIYWCFYLKDQIEHYVGSYKQKYVHELLVNHLSLPRKKCG